MHVFKMKPFFISMDS